MRFVIRAAALNSKVVFASRRAGSQFGLNPCSRYSSLNVTAMAAPKNYHVVLKGRPGPNEPVKETMFATEELPYPKIGQNQVLVKTLYLSVDPTLRFAITTDRVPHYLQAWQIDQTVSGIGGIGEIVESQALGHKKGDLVSFVLFPWQKYIAVDAGKLRKHDKQLLGGQPSAALNLLGHIGLTAYIGLKLHGNIRKGSNQTFVVSGAAGATGMAAGQIARIQGCARIVGICGSDDKCRYLTENLQFDAAINYKTEDVRKRLKETCPYGIDVYFDNVGGDISKAVVEQMNQGSNIAVCGQISQYNKVVDIGGILYATPPELEPLVKQKNITRKGFLLPDLMEQAVAGLPELAAWVKEGKLKTTETVEYGLENAGRAFAKMLNGENLGKMIVKVADEE